MRKILYGIAFNDVDYNVTIGKSVDGKYKNLWICPFYRTWNNMLSRCYGVNKYKSCSVKSNWLYLSDFKGWMEKQNWQGNHLDKDLLFPGNKIYGDDTCVFVDAEVNSFVIEKPKKGLPMGCTFSLRKNKYVSFISINGKSKNLGYFDDPFQAHEAWLSEKIKLAKVLASKQSDPRVSAALIDRYENYHIYFPEAR